MKPFSPNGPFNASIARMLQHGVELTCCHQRCGPNHGGLNSARFTCCPSHSGWLCSNFRATLQLQFCPGFGRSAGRRDDFRLDRSKAGPLSQEPAVPVRWSMAGEHGD